MALPPKLCPECGEEYVHTATSCVHCDVELVGADELAVAPARDLPPASELRLVRAAGVGWVLALSEQLAELGIPHRVEPLEQPAVEGSGPPGPYGVFVREADLATARRVDAAHVEREIPDLREGPATAVRDDVCPACGDPIGEEDAECAGCGLALGAEG